MYFADEQIVDDIIYVNIIIWIVSLLSYYKIYSIRAGYKWMIILDIMDDNNFYYWFYSDWRKNKKIKEK